MIFKDGEFIEFPVETERGVITLAADVRIDGEKLILRDILIYGDRDEPLTGNAGLLFKLRSELKSLAKADGFKTIVLMGYRSEKSSSANPKRDVIVTINLKEERDA